MLVLQGTLRPKERGFMTKQQIITDRLQTIIMYIWEELKEDDILFVVSEFSNKKEYVKYTAYHMLKEQIRNHEMIDKYFKKYFEKAYKIQAVL